MNRPMADWEVRSLASLGTYLNGFAFKPGHWGDQGLPIVRIRELLDPTVEPDRYDGLLAQDFKIEDGDLIFSWSATLAALFWDRGPAYLNQHLFKVTAANDVNLRFLKHLINFHLDRLSVRSHGTTMKHVTRGDLEAYMVELPTSTEQRRIAEILDAVDSQIRSTERIIEKLHSAERGMTDALLTPAHSAGRIGSDATPASLPTGWRTGHLVTFCTLQRGFDITQAEQREGPYPVISSSGITSYHDRFMINGPGVVTGRKGSLGGVYYCDGPFWPHDTSLWVKDFHGNDPEFIALLLKFLRLERFDAATSVPTLNRNTIHPLRVAVPTPSQQHEIVSALKKFTSRARAEEAYLAKLRLITSGLLSDLLTGRVQVPARAA